MLHLKPRLHPERRALFDGKRLLVQRLQRAGFAEVDDDVRAAGDFQPERVDDYLAGIVGVGDGGACSEAERGFPFFERFVVCVELVVFVDGLFFADLFIYKRGRLGIWCVKAYASYGDQGEP